MAQTPPIVPYHTSALFEQPAAPFVLTLPPRPHWEAALGPIVMSVILSTIFIAGIALPVAVLRNSGRREVSADWFLIPVILAAVGLGAAWCLRSAYNTFRHAAVPTTIAADADSLRITTAWTGTPLTHTIARKDIVSIHVSLRWSPTDMRVLRPFTPLLRLDVQTRDRLIAYRCPARIQLAPANIEVSLINTLRLIQGSAPQDLPDEAHWI